MQPLQQKMNVDDAKAALGIATRISEGLMPKIEPKTDLGTATALNSPTGMPVQDPAMTQDQSNTAKHIEDMKSKHEAKMTEIETKMDQMKSEMEIMVKDEISGIKDLIIEALKEDNGQKD